MPSTPGVSRRRFLTTSLATAAGFAAVPRAALGGPGQTPPSDTLLQAVVGTGGMGMGHVGMVLGDRSSQLVAVCDVDASHLATALKQAGDRCTGYSDFREVLGGLQQAAVRMRHSAQGLAASPPAATSTWCTCPHRRTGTRSSPSPRRRRAATSFARSR